MNCTAIILAAGMSSRMKGTDKQLLSIDGIPVIVRSAMNFQNTSAVSEIIIAAKGELCADIEAICQKAGVTKLKAVCAGGETRAKSAEAAFLLAGETEVTLIHDGARPFASPEIITAVAEAAYENGGAIAAVPVTDTIKCVKDGFIESTPDRSALYGAQTPQGFRTGLYRKMLAQSGDFTDDSQLAEAMGIKVKIVTGSYDNIKITTPEDIARAEIIAAKEQ